MTSKVATVAKVFRSFGFAGVAYKVLGRLGIPAGQAWLKDRLIHRYQLTDDPWTTMKCPHCGRSLEKAAAGLVCPTCQDVFV